MNYSKIEPRNDEWNRKFGFTDEKSEGFLLEVKNGTAYFAWGFQNGETRFYKCEEPVFLKHFIQHENEMINHEMVPGKLEFSRYPVSK